MCSLRSIFTSLLFGLALIVAPACSAQINPANQINWPTGPSGCVYAPGTNTCVSAGGGGTVATPFAYTFYVSSGTVYAINNLTGATAASGTDAAAVTNTVLAAAATTGATLYYKPGTYPLNSCTAETVTPYTTLSYAIGIPATNSGTNYPEFYFVGESNMSGSQNAPATSGVIFNVTSTALSCASTNTFAAVWMRPSTVHNSYYSGTLYWNDHISLRGIAFTFPNNTQTNVVAVDALEASYLELIDVSAGFVTAPTALGASGTVAYISPATPSDGVRIINTYANPGWATGFQVNTEHSLLDSAVAYESTTGYSYGGQRNRNNSPIYHSSNWRHVECYDDVNCFTSNDANVSAGSRLDLDFDLEYIQTGSWTYSTGITTGNDLGGILHWSQVKTNVGRGSLTTPFASGSGDNYMLINSDSTYGVANVQVTVGTSAISANTCTSYSTVPMQGLKSTSVILDPTPSADYSGVTGWSSAGSTLYFNFYPTTDTLHWQVCNNTTASITPGSSTTWNVGGK